MTDADEENLNAALDACYYSLVTSEPSPAEERAISALRSGLQVGHLAVVNGGEVAELRRKAAHYHAQRMEADERNAKLEDALRRTRVALLSTAGAFHSVVQHAGDADCAAVYEAVMETAVEPTSDAARRLLQ